MDQHDDRRDAAQRIQRQEPRLLHVIPRKAILRACDPARAGPRRQAKAPARCDSATVSGDGLLLRARVA
ncbi:MAG: hypothetical protein DI605_02670 [Sphingomonas sp.]|nr:MAG: hypothetical protein DI605_02670 [Sphingomonas sp.]